MSKSFNSNAFQSTTPFQAISPYIIPTRLNSQNSLSLSCPECGHLGFLPHNLGQVCPVCGIVNEKLSFYTGIPYYNDRNNKSCTYHKPKGFTTMVGKKEERTTSKHRKLNQVCHMFKDGGLEEARGYFRHYLSILDIEMDVENLVIVFDRIYSKLPRYSRSKNIAHLTFGIMFKTAQPIYCLKLNSTIKKCDCELKKIMAIFYDIKQNQKSFEELFEAGDAPTILHSLSSAQKDLEISSDDIPYIRKILKDPLLSGIMPQIKAAKALLLFYKAKQLTKFFRILKEENICDWISFLKQLSNPKWCKSVECQIPALDLQEIARVFNVSKTPLYLCYGQKTWIKSRIISNSPKKTVRCGKLRISEKCLDAFFTQSKAGIGKNRTTPSSPIHS
ncbi:MAG: hypothetical protein ACTSVZ_01820 [Promethearchaeota archaeon]